MRTLNTNQLHFARMESAHILPCDGEERDEGKAAALVWIGSAGGFAKIVDNGKHGLGCWIYHADGVTQCAYLRMPEHRAGIRSFLERLLFLRKTGRL